MTLQAKKQYVDACEFFSKTGAEEEELVKNADIVAKELKVALCSRTLLIWFTRPNADRVETRKGCLQALKELGSLESLLHPALSARAKLAISLKL